MRAWGVIAVVAGSALAWGLGCPGVDPYACSVDSQCMLGTMVGVCDPREDRCAYPDTTCTSGLRFPAQTDRGLAEQCTEPSASLGSSEDSSASASSSSSLGSGSTDGGDESSSSGGSGCTLAASPPLDLDLTTYEGPIERLVIDAEGEPAIRIVGVPDAELRDLEIHYSGLPGIVVEDSPGLVIERVLLVNAGAPPEGPAGAGEYGIQVARSPGATIRNIRVQQPLTGIQVEDSDDLLIQAVIVQNARGQPVDTGGDGVLVQTSARVTVEQFASINDDNDFELGEITHAGVFIDRCTDTVVRDGLATSIYHQSGAGVRVHTTEREGNVRVERVDVRGGTHSCFDVQIGVDVVLTDTGCREVERYGWATTTANFVGPASVVGGWYYAVRTPIVPTRWQMWWSEFSAQFGQETANIPPVVAPPCDLR